MSVVGQRTHITYIFHKVFAQVINKLLVVHKLTLSLLWICLKNLKPLPTDEHI